MIYFYLDDQNHAIFKYKIHFLEGVAARQTATEVILS